MNLTTKFDISGEKHLFFKVNTAPKTVLLLIIGDC